MEGRKTTSIQQLELLLSFMEGHKNFAVGQVRSREGRATSARLWEQCAEILNAEGVTRTPKDWSKFWNDYKCRVRAKVSEINRGFRATGGGPSRVTVLTPLEERVAALLGRDVGPLTGVRQDPEIQIEYINNTVEMDGEREVTLPASNSPVLDLHLTQENAGAPVNISPDVSRTATLETPAESQQRDTQEVNNQPASQGSTPTTGRPSTRQPGQNRPRRGAARPRYVHQSNTAALDEARATIARIEEMRARTDLTMATAASNISSALTSMAESMSSMTEILRVYLTRNPSS